MSSEAEKKPRILKVDNSIKETTAEKPDRISFFNVSEQKMTKVPVTDHKRALEVKQEFDTSKRPSQSGVSSICGKRELTDGEANEVERKRRAAESTADLASINSKRTNATYRAIGGVGVKSSADAFDFNNNRSHSKSDVKKMTEISGNVSEQSYKAVNRIVNMDINMAGQLPSHSGSSFHKSNDRCDMETQSLVEQNVDRHADEDNGQSLPYYWKVDIG